MKTSDFKKRSNAEMYCYRQTVLNLNTPAEGTVGDTPIGLQGSDLPKNSNEELTEIEDDQSAEFVPKPKHIQMLAYVKDHIYNIIISIFLIIVIPTVIQTSEKCAVYRAEIDNIKERVALLDINSVTKEELSYEILLMESDYKMMIFSSEVDLESRVDDLEYKIDNVVDNNKK